MNQFPWQTHNIFRKVLPVLLMTAFISVTSYSQETGPLKSFHGVPVTKRFFNDDTTKLLRLFRCNRYRIEKEMPHSPVL
ncbi:MAG TPA: hypothetical protein VIQ00_10070 [Chitinophagaceae bacterium]